ncbi:hypothetical protein, partial [Pectobacterium punjabense]|uniref:hypothetical protein n=1 Tax=Pectobacterium punjabense TaxID=2108399 RepID=UPI002406E5FA
FLREIPIKTLVNSRLFYDMIPSPAPYFKETSLTAGFLLLGIRTPELHSIIRRKRLILSGPARQARCSTPPAFVRVQHSFPFLCPLINKHIVYIQYLALKTFSNAF